MNDIPSAAARRLVRGVVGLIAVGVAAAVVAVNGAAAEAQWRSRSSW